MPRYKSHRQYQSRLEKQENKRLRRQTLLIIIATLALIVFMVFVGVPSLSKMAIFLSDAKSGGAGTGQSDVIPPQTPQLSSPLEATNSSKLNLSGYSEPGATVTLFQNNQEKIKTIVDAGGKFEFLKIELTPGQNSFYAQAKDAAENTSQRSLIRTVSYDTEPPELTVSDPEEGAQIFGVTKQTISVAGITEPGAKLELNGQIIVVKSDGAFTTRHSLNQGDNLLTFIATDEAGNQTAKDITVSYSESQ